MKPISTFVVRPRLAAYASASAVPRFLSSKVWIDRSAFKTAMEDAPDAMAPVALTSTLRPAKNARPGLFVTAGP